jgi:hypothetical protein
LANKNCEAVRIDFYFVIGLSFRIGKIPKSKFQASNPKKYFIAGPTYLLQAGFLEFGI